MLLASRELYEQLADRCDNGFGLVKRGLLMLCRTRAGLEEETRAARRARELDLPVEIVSPARAAEIDPGTAMEIAGAVFYPLDCHLDPRLLMRKLVELATAAGVTIRWSTRVDGWRTVGERVAAAHDFAGRPRGGRIRAGRGRLVGASLRARSVASCRSRAARAIPSRCPIRRSCPGCRAILSEAHVAVTPMGASLRIGGTMEFAGLDRSVSERRTQAIAAAAAQYFPALRAQDIAQVRPWAGLRPCSPDGLPYIGRFARYSNLCAAAGHAMLGISLAPITGQLVAQVAGRRATADRARSAQPAALFMRNDDTGTSAMNWKGVIPAITTNLDASGAVDHAALGSPLRVDDCERLHGNRVLRVARRSRHVEFR